MGNIDCNNAMPCVGNGDGTESQNGRNGAPKGGLTANRGAKGAIRRSNTDTGRNIELLMEQQQ